MSPSHLARRFITRTMSTLSTTDMPTLTRSYILKTLTPPAADTSLFPASAALNDRITIIRNDITKLKVDGIVNAANSSLLGGGGVDGSIHRAAGPELVEECETLGGCETGDAKITKGYELPASHVIHTVGPIYHSSKGEAAALLKSCYRRSLEVAMQNSLKTVAFPAISTGVYGYPNAPAAKAALEEVRGFLEDGRGDGIERVIFCIFTDKDMDAYEKYTPRIFPPTEDTLKEIEDKGPESSMEPSLHRVPTLPVNTNP